MSNQDIKFSRVAPTFIDQDTQHGGDGRRYMEDDPKAGLPKERWDEYRLLYKRNKIKLGVQRDKVGNAFIMVDSIGLLNRGHSTGYLFCQSDEANQQPSFEPCGSGLQEGSRQYDPATRAEGYSFRKLADHWYAFDQGPS